VKHAELTSTLPYSDQGWVNDFQIENRPLTPGKFQSALRLPVSAGYLAAFQIPIVSGRGFNADDTLRSQPVTVISQHFAARYFAGESPLGRRIRMGGAASEQTPWMTIVGVAQETSYNLFLRMDTGEVYLDSAQQPPLGMTYSIIAAGDPLSLAPAARKALAALDPGMPLDDVETYAQYLHEKLVGLVYVAVMLGMDALIALLLAAIGIFGVMANLVAERTREIGVRLAMGARREDVLRLILRRAAILTSTGLAVGLLLAVGLAHGVANLLYGVSPYDPVVFGSIASAIAAIAIASSWIPARRAAAVDPIVALRDQ
jgi:putative ABC transport system permease protein